MWTEATFSVTVNVLDSAIHDFAVHNIIQLMCLLTNFAELYCRRVNFLFVFIYLFIDKF